MVKVSLIVCGTLLVGLGFIGIILPGLPTTPFLMLAAGCYARSSQRFYNMLINSRSFGPTIRQFQEDRSIPRNVKIKAISMLWVMITLTGTFAVTGTTGRIILFFCGLTGMTTILAIKTSR